MLSHLGNLGYIDIAAIGKHLENLGKKGTRLMTKRLFLLIMFGFAVLAAAEANPGDRFSGMRIDAVVSAFPFIPSMSKVSVDVPLSVIVGNENLSRFILRSWYLASTPYLVPGKFFEIGTLAEYVFADSKSTRWLVGVGTAYSQDQGAISVPLIVALKAAFGISNWLTLAPSWENFVYGEGALSDLQLVASFDLFGNGILIDFGIGADLAYSWKLSAYLLDYGLSIGVSYRF